MLAAVTPFLIFAAFVLLLLVSLSVPIIKTIYLFKLTAHVSSSVVNSSASGSVRYGVWGYCASAVNVSIFGTSHSESSAQCSQAKLGYTFDSTVANALNANGIEQDLSRTTTAALVLHPIACVLTFIALLFSLFMVRRGYYGQKTTSRLASFLTLGFASIATLVTTIVFLIDVILVGVLRSKIHKDTHGDLTVVWGPAVWMALGATVALWGSLVGACAGLCCGGRRRGAY